jgi:hypothetical protein
MGLKRTRSNAQPALSGISFLDKTAPGKWDGPKEMSAYTSRTSPNASACTNLESLIVWDSLLDDWKIISCLTVFFMTFEKSKFQGIFSIDHKMMLANVRCVR